MRDDIDTTDRYLINNEATGKDYLLNRRAFNERLRKLGRAYAVAMVDIDRFKTFNDTFGHAEGDNVLRYVATHLLDHARGQVFRYGGEEFAVIYPAVASAEAAERLEHARAGLAGERFAVRGGERQGRRRRGAGGEQQRVALTISAGVAGPRRTARRPPEVLALADQALYQAKASGRNRVALAEQEPVAAQG